MRPRASTSSSLGSSRSSQKKWSRSSCSRITSSSMRVKQGTRRFTPREGSSASSSSDLSCANSLLSVGRAADYLLDRALAGARCLRQPTQQLCQLLDLLIREVIEERGVHAGDVCAAGLAQALVAVVGELRVGHAQVLGTGDALDQAG